MAAGEGQDPGSFVKFKLFVTYTCENGAGKVVANVVTDSAEQIQYAIIGQTNNFAKNATSGASSHTFENVPDGTYTVFASLLLTQSANDSDEVTVECGLVEVDVCDLLIDAVEVTESMQTVASGTAVINITKTGTDVVEYKVDDLPWQFSPNFYSLSKGLHTAYVRYQTNTVCFDDAEFTIPSPFIAGCTNEEADNWTPGANEDDGSCVYTPKVFATGGILPNPVIIPVSFPTTIQGVTKTNHYVKLNLYRKEETTPFASLRQTLREGKAKIDVATYLRNKMLNEFEKTTQLMIGNPNNSLPFYVGIEEHYGGSTQPEKLRIDPPRFAVNAALQDYPGDVMPYVLEPGEALLKDFMYAISDPVLVEGYNQSVSLFIRPDAPQPLYFQRRYMDIRKQDVEIRSTLIPANLYGTRVDFNLFDRAILCAEYLVVTIETEQNLLTGICPANPDEEDGIFDFTFDYQFE